MSEHRMWCDRALCDEATHRGRVGVIVSKDGFGSLFVQMRQATVEGTVPIIAITSDSGQVDLSVGMARALAFSLRQRAKLAGALVTDIGDGAQ